MSQCAVCGERILFGGIKQGNLQYCNALCQSKAQLAAAAATVPESEAQAFARQIHQGPCPRCKGPGPVDVHTSYWVWSGLAFTRWGSQPQLKCRGCGIKSQLGNLVFSGVLGWWGFPWGFLWTPVQVVRNIAAIVSPPDPSQPSARLVQIAHLQLAGQKQKQ
jgi:hypothetical protein